MDFVMRLLSASLLLGACTLLSGCFEDADQIPDFVPKAGIGKHGYEIHPKTLIDEELKVYWSQQAVTGRSKATYADIPKKVIVKSTNQRCSFSENRPDENIRIVSIDAPKTSRNYGETVPIFSSSEDLVVKNVKQWLKRYKRKSKAPEPWPSVYSGTSMDLVDVVVTDTSGPIRLVLKSTRDNVLWNIHAGRNVHISRVAILSHGEMAGVANITEATEVEMLTASELKECGVEIAREPQEHWKVFYGTKGVLSIHDEHKIAELREAFNKYSKWFAAEFDQSPSKNAINAASASMILVGDVPPTLEERIKYKPVKGALVVVSQQNGLVVGDPEKFKQSYFAQIKDTAAQVLGVDVSTLNGS